MIKTFGEFLIGVIAMTALVLFMNGAFAQTFTNKPLPDSSWWGTPAIMKCCSEADAVYADEFRVNHDGTLTVTVTGTGPRNHEWAVPLLGREFTVQPWQVVNEPGNPTGRAILFIAPMSNHVYCYALGPLT